MNCENHISLKTSKYNLIVLRRTEIDIVYNTLQDSITAIKNSKPFSYMRVDEIKRLYGQGIILNSCIDEKEVFRYRNMRQKMNGKRLHVFITLTGCCNCNCSYCFARGCYSKSTIEKEDIPLILKFIVQQLDYHRSTLLNIDFFGGEPLICENIYLELMEKIQEIGRRFHAKTIFQFYSNGTIKPNCGYDVFVKKYDTTFLITLDGPKEIHDRYRPMKSGGSGFDRIIGNLSDMKKAGCKAIIRINYGKNSWKHIWILLDELVKLDFVRFPVEFYPVQNMTKSSKGYKEAVSNSEMQKISSILWKEAKKRSIQVNLRTLSANCYCTAFTNSMFVLDPNLNVYKCALLQCDSQYSVGNLKKNNVLLTDNTFYDWMNYDPSTEKNCSNCVSLPICAGGCGGSGTFRYGTHHHSNCFDLSPMMVKLRMKEYVLARYEKSIAHFRDSNNDVLILEKSKYCNP